MKQIVFPGIAMIAVTYAFARFSFGFFLPDMNDSLGLTAAEGGVASSLAYAAYCLALFISTLFIKKVGQDTVIRFAGVSAVVGMIGLAGAQNFFMLAIAAFIAGLGSGWSSPAYSQVSFHVFSSLQRDRANTWINTGTSFGLVLTGPIAFAFTEYWRLAYVWFALVALLVLVWNWKLIPKGGQIIDEDRSKRNRHPLVNAHVWHLFFGAFVIGASSAIYWTFSRSFLTVEHGMSSVEGILFWMFMGASGILGGIAGGVIEKFGLRTTYRCILLVMLASIALLTLSSVFFIFTSSILFGFSYIFMTGVLIVWATQLFDRPSEGVGFSFLMLGIGQSIGTFVAGHLIEWSSYTWSFLVFALFGLVALFVIVKGKS